MHARKARRAAGMWRLAAYGSSGLEESAQDRDLEERVERHVVVCARASGSGRVSARASGQASLRAGEGLVGYGSGAAALAVRGLALWAEPVGLLGVSFAFLSDTLRGKPRFDAPATGPRIKMGGIIAAYAASTHESPHPLTRTGASWGVASGGVNVPLTNTQSARDSSPPTPNTTRQTPDATTD